MSQDPPKKLTSAIIAAATRAVMPFVVKRSLKPKLKTIPNAELLRIADRNPAPQEWYDEE